MKVAVNTRLLIKDKMDGIGLFTYHSFQKIVLANPDVSFYFIFDREPDADFIYANNITAKVINPKARHPLLYKIWYQVSLKKLLKKINPDIFVGTDGMIPLNSSTKTLAIIHDLNFEHYPEQLPKAYRNYYKKYFPLFAKKANRIATVSEYSKKDICETYQIPSEKIDVVYNGASSNFSPIAEEKKVTIREKVSSGHEYFLFVGSLHPRKNLQRLFKAFDTFKSNTESDFKLVIVGKKMWWSDEMENTYQNLKYKNDIIFTGRVNDTRLGEITASAYALSYVPIFEGFGIPLVEAMTCGVPVITSNVTSMPEVVQDAGILTDPFSEKSIAEAMEKLATDKVLRKELSLKSVDQAKKFSWDKTAQLLWKSITKTIHA